MVPRQLWWCGALLFGASAAHAAETPFARPLVTITLDDGFQSQWDLARPALNAHGMKATYFLISDAIQAGASHPGWSGYLTLSEARTLAADGNEIGDHTVTHPELPNVSASQLEQELSASKAWLQSSVGVANVADFASPYGETNDAVIARVQAYFASHRNQRMGRVFSGDDRYQLRGAYVRNTTTVAQIQAWIDQTIVEGSWLVLTFHEFTSSTPTRETQYPAASFSAVLDYLQSRGVAVATVAGGVAQLGATQDQNPVKWIYGDWFGNDVEDWSWAKLDFRETAVVHDGRSAISFEPDQWGGLAFHVNGGFDPQTYGAIELWLNGGAGGGQKVQVSLHDGDTTFAQVPVEKLLGHAIAANTWQKVTVRLADLGVSARVFEIYLEDTSGGNQPTLYVDSVVLRPTAATPPPPPPPPPPPTTAALVIYDDALRNGFEDWSWAVHASEGTTVRSGAAALSFEPDDWAGLYFHHAGVDTTPYSAIELYVNGGHTGGEDILVAVWDGDVLLGQVDVPQILGHPLRPDTWEHVVVPLSAVGAKGRPLRDLYVQDNSGANQPAVYVDDVRLIP